ncbi:penicillin-binding transpeptidase domain-containing protein [Alkalibacterium sp. MB6]|uniref:penicillin-binding transpeptidase domain-containing protein n=1 Tax=Alkalibacterium sp. MB6 TaxID=2081965 RepID=UPI00137ADE86|nr:penicillin-binding transpeptidase domain-containing protein [Alkalibacterium sp. MB6]
MKQTKHSSNKRNSKLGLIIAVVVSLLIVGGIVGFFWYRNYQEKQLAIQRQNEVESLVSDYLAARENQDFATMVSYFTDESLQAQGYLSEEELSERYDTIFSGIGADEPSITSDNLVYDEETDTYSLSYTMQIETALGTLSDLQYATSIVETEEETLLVWDHDLLLPGMAEGDTVNLSYSSPNRGSIYDRHGNMLAGEGESWQAGMYPAAMGEDVEREASIDTISQEFNVSTDRLEALLAQGWVTEESFVPFAFVEEGQTPEILGVRYQRTTERVYPLREAAAHLIGYVGEVSAEDIENNPTLQPGQKIGKAGLEATFEEQLKGIPGGRLTIMDRNQEVKMVLMENDKQDGESIYLTIDFDIQEELFQAFEEGEPGTAAVMDPTTGDLIALASSPSYNPQSFARGMSSEEYNAYLENTNNPFLNRATARYVPGSTFKILTSMALLEKGPTTTETVNQIEGLQWSPGIESFGNHSITRVNSSISEVNLASALIYSDNIFFAMEALKMDTEEFEEALNLFPFGESMSLPLNMQAAQFANDNTINQPTLQADTAYGQGEVLMNTIHQLVFYTPTHNDGQLIWPRLIRDEETAEPLQVVSKETADVIEASLIEVVNHPSGTARRLQSLPYQAGAKTGTAEIAGEEGNDANGLLYAYDAEDYQYAFIGLLEDQVAGDAIDRFSPFLANVKTMLE